MWQKSIEGDESRDLAAARCEWDSYFTKVSLRSFFTYATRCEVLKNSVMCISSIEKQKVCSRIQEHSKDQFESSNPRVR